MIVLNAMLASGMGGMEQMSVTYIKALVQNGHEVHALYMADSPYLPELLALGVQVHLMKSRSVLNPLNALKIARLLRQIKPDIVFLHGNRVMRLARYPVIRHVLKSPAPLVGKAHNFDCKHLPIMDYSIATTRYWQKEQAKITGKEVFYLPNTVPLTPKRTPRFHDVPVIGAMSRLHINKAYDTLLRAAKVLKERGVTFQLIIGGDGPEKENLTALRHELGLDNIVSFIGWIKDKEDFYDKIDIFCLSSRTEPFGTVVLEAMVRSCPVVSTDCAGPKEMIEHGISGLICPIDVVDKMADALEEMLKDPQKALEMGQKGREAVEKSYAFPSFCRSLDELIQRVVSKR